MIRPRRNTSTNKEKTEYFIVSNAKRMSICNKKCSFITKATEARCVKRQTITADQQCAGKRWSTIDVTRRERSGEIEIERYTGAQEDHFTVISHGITTTRSGISMHIQATLADVSKDGVEGICIESDWAGITRVCG